MELNKFELIYFFFKLLIMDNLKQQFPYVDNEILDLANVKDKMIIKELTILNTEREKAKEKYKAESINKCIDLERQLSEALFELNYLKERITKEKEKEKEKEIKDYVSSDL